MGGKGSGKRPTRGVRADKQTCVRWTPAEWEAVESARGPGEGDAELVRRLALGAVEAQRGV